VAAVLAITACAEGDLGLKHPSNAVRWPVSVLADSDGRHVYVVNSNFDQRYGSGTLNLVDLVERKVVDDGVIAINSFGGMATGFFGGPSGELSDIFVPSRDGDAVTRVRVSHTPTSPPRLSCGKSPTTRETRCAEEYILSPELDLDPGGEPFALALIGEPAGSLVVLVTAGLGDGTLHFFRVCDTERDPCEDGALFEPIERTVECEDEEDEECEGGEKLVPVVASVGSGIQDLLYHPHTKDLLISQRGFGLVRALPLRLGREDGRPTVQLGSTRSLFMPADPGSRDYGSDMALAPDGRRVALIWRAPNSLAMLEPDDTAAGGYRLTSQTPIGRGASRLAFAALGPGYTDRVFATCSIEDHLYVVQPETGIVTDVVATGPGPFDLAVINRPELSRRWIVTADFEGDTLTVIDADPESMSYLEPIAHVHGKVVER
jgi:hypothetical protein